VAPTPRAWQRGACGLGGRGRRGLDESVLERACSGTHTGGRELKRSGAIPACTEAKIEKPDDILGEQSADACGRSSAGTRGSRVCTQRSAHRGQGGGTAWRAGAVERFSESGSSESRGQLPAGWPLPQLSLFIRTDRNNTGGRKPLKQAIPKLDPGCPVPTYVRGQPPNFTPWLGARPETALAGVGHVP
jgi:hypothetical protein